MTCAPLAACSFSVKVDNMAYDTQKDELRSIFDKYGDIKDVFIPMDRDRRPRGFAFVR